MRRADIAIHSERPKMVCFDRDNFRDHAASYKKVMCIFRFSRGDLTCENKKFCPRTDLAVADAR